MKIESCRTTRLIDNGRQIPTVERKATDIGPVSEEQGRVSFISFTMRTVVWVSCVTRNTFALETAFFIDARLGACSRIKAFVNI